jgi:hypothetical protein
MPHSIRAIDYTGDLETLRDVYLLGPFPSAGERDGEIQRLYQLPGMRGSYDFEASELDPASGAHAAVTATAAAQVRSADDLERAFFPPPR